MSDRLRDDGWPWPALDHRRAAELLQASPVGARTQPLEPAGEGDFCLAFSSGEDIIRVARHLEASRSLRREACLLDRIAGALPLPVPQPTFHAPPDCPPFSVHPRISGEVLTRATWTALPNAARERAAAELARFLGVLHGLPVAIAAACEIPALDPAATADRLLGDGGRFLRMALDPWAWRRLERELKRWITATAASAPLPALLHCDIAPGHLLCDPVTGSLTGIIDFGDTSIGDPARDFIHVYEDFGPELLARVLVHYDREGTPALERAIRRWYLLEAAAWSAERPIIGAPGEAEEGLRAVAAELAGLSS